MSSPEQRPPVDRTPLPPELLGSMVAERIKAFTEIVPQIPAFQKAVTEWYIKTGGEKTPDHRTQFTLDGQTRYSFRHTPPGESSQGGGVVNVPGELRLAHTRRNFEGDVNIREILLTQERVNKSDLSSTKPDEVGSNALFKEITRAVRGGRVHDIEDISLNDREAFSKIDEFLNELKAHVPKEERTNH